MPPKRPRIAPSQTNLSVQDVRDYSTPEGAAMANEEMRRLKLAIDEVKAEQVVQAAAVISAGAAQAGGGQGDVIVPPEVSYSWYIKAANYVAQEVKDKQTVTFRGVDGIRVSQVGKTITIGMPPVAWIVIGDVGSHSVKTTSTLRIVGINGVSTSVNTAISTLTIDRPLTVYERGRAIGNAGTIGLDFWNDANYIKKHEHNKIHFHVQDIGNGVRRVTGYYVGGGGNGTMSTWVASDSISSYIVNNSDTVEWVGVNGVVVTLYPNNAPYPRFEIDRPLQMQQSNTNIGGVDTTAINMDNATLAKPLGHNSRVWTEVVDNANGKRSLRFYYDPAGITTTSLQIQQRSIDIGGNDTGTLNFDNDVNRKPDNYTGRVYAQVVDDTNGKRSVRLWHTPGDLNFSKWRIAANGTAGESDVLNDELVTFIGRSGIKVERQGDNIVIFQDPDSDPGSPYDPNRIVTGTLIFDNTNTDYITGGNKPAWKYGVRKYQDIVHNFDLGNPQNFEFQLLDINSDESTPLIYYRNGATTLAGQTLGAADTLSGPNLGKIRFRNIPHVIGYNENVVRVFATMSRGKPTEMRFRYFIRSL